MKEPVELIDLGDLSELQRLPIEKLDELATLVHGPALLRNVREEREIRRIDALAKETESLLAETRKLLDESRKLR